MTIASLPADLRDSRPAAFLLDFDGVILDSVRIKIDAYLKIYEHEDPSKRATILEHQRVHGGVTRRVKFRYFERHLFGRAGTDEDVERLSATYTRLVHEAVLTCAFIPGAQAFLERVHGRAAMHVVSGTPDEELKDIVERRGLARYFVSVHGAPQTKIDAFRELLQSRGYDPARALAIGDAMTECEAAAMLGIPFLGVTHDTEFAVFPPTVPCVPTLEGLAEALGFR
jgi:beta-phosphoglucomutase-like phosphatase (HAD superfamily)